MKHLLLYVCVLCLGVCQVEASRTHPIQEVMEQQKKNKRREEWGQPPVEVPLEGKKLYEEVHARLVELCEQTRSLSPKDLAFFLASKTLKTSHDVPLIPLLRHQVFLSYHSTDDCLLEEDWGDYTGDLFVDNKTYYFRYRKECLFLEGLAYPFKYESQDPLIYYHIVFLQEGLHRALSPNFSYDEILLSNRRLPVIISPAAKEFWEKEINAINYVNAQSFDCK